MKVDDGPLPVGQDAQHIGLGQLVRLDGEGALPARRLDIEAGGPDYLAALVGDKVGPVG